MVVGGSGGSIWIISRQMDGIGTISANGGDATGLSGAGSAGRVAVYTTEINEYPEEGKFKVNGGNAPTPFQCGGGGTVYLQVSSRSKVANHLDPFSVVVKERYTYISTSHITFCTYNRNPVLQLV